MRDWNLSSWKGNKRLSIIDEDPKGDEEWKQNRDIKAHDLNVTVSVKYWLYLHNYNCIRNILFDRNGEQVFLWRNVHSLEIQA